MSAGGGLLLVQSSRRAAGLASLVSDPDYYYEDAPAQWAAYVALWTAAIAALLALGVAINRSAGRLRAHE